MKHLYLLALLFLPLALIAQSDSMDIPTSSFWSIQASSQFILPMGGYEESIQPIGFDSQNGEFEVYPKATFDNFSLGGSYSNKIWKKSSLSLWVRSALDWNHISRQNIKKGHFSDSFSSFSGSIHNRISEHHIRTRSTFRLNLQLRNRWELYSELNVAVRYSIYRSGEATLIEDGSVHQSEYRGWLIDDVIFSINTSLWFGIEFKLYNGLYIHTGVGLPYNIFDSDRVFNETVSPRSILAYPNSFDNTHYWVLSSSLILKLTKANKK